MHKIGTTRQKSLLRCIPRTRSWSGGDTFPSGLLYKPLFIVMSSPSKGSIGSMIQLVQGFNQFKYIIAPMVQLVSRVHLGSWFNWFKCSIDSNVASVYDF